MSRKALPSGGFYVFMTSGDLMVLIYLVIIFGLFLLLAYFRTKNKLKKKFVELSRLSPEERGKKVATENANTKYLFLVVVPLAILVSLRGQIGTPNAFLLSFGVAILVKLLFYRNDN